MEDWKDELSPGMKCIKYLMIAFNSIFIMTGVLIIAVGSTIHSIYYNFDEFLETRFFSPATLLIVIGSFIFVIALFGCIGAARESTCFINIFGLMLAVIFVLEISAGIAAFALQGTIENTIAYNMNLTMYEYEDPMKPEAKETIDLINSGLSCCGIKGPEDWKGVIKGGPQFPLNDDEIILPDSCCAELNPINVADETLTCLKTYKDGCLDSLTFVVAQSAILLGGAALTVSIIQVIGIYFSYSLAKSIRRAKTERVRRQYEIRRQLQNSYSLMNGNDEKRSYPENLNPSNLNTYNNM